MVEVCLPGTGEILPLEDRWTANCWVGFQSTAILIDCGEGTQIALKKADYKLSRLELLLIIHFHVDHITELPGLLLTLGSYGKRTPFMIVGPAGLGQMVASLMTITPNLPCPIVLKELNGEIRGFDLFGIHFASMHLQHGIPYLGYHLTLKRKPIFSPGKVKELGAPLHYYKTPHADQPAVLDNDNQILPYMVLDEEHRPINICYCTDTQPIEEISSFAHGADLFACEGMYRDEAMNERVQEKGHMAFSDSARLAQRAEIKQLWLTHFSPAMKEPGQYLDAVMSIFRHTTIDYDGIHTTLGP